MRRLFFLWFYILPFSLFAQLHDNTWLNGFLTTFPLDHTESKITFGNMVPHVIAEPERLLDMRQCGTTVSDAEGNLIFYTNCHQIANRKNQIMEGGDSINFAYPAEEGRKFRSGGIYPQGAIALPRPGNPEEYILLHISEGSIPEDPFIIGSHLLYSKINMNLNNGDGVVVEKNQIVIADTLQINGLLTTRHANGRDWWLLVFEAISARYYRVLVSDQGVSVVGQGETDTPIYPDLGVGGFSPDGTKYVVTPLDFQAETFSLELFDFDRCTGLLSNHKRVEYLSNPQDFDFPYFEQAFSSCFSPNSRFLYFNRLTKLYQLDMQDPELKVEKIADFDGFLPRYFFYNVFGYTGLFPDGLIYMTPAMPTEYYHVIRQPNEPGRASHFKQHSLVAYGASGYSMPNHPNYRLGPLEGSGCDTLGIEKAVFVHAHPYDQTACIGGGTHFEVTAFGTGLSYQWQRSTDGGGTWQALSLGSHFSDVNTEYLLVNDILANYDGHVFRCIVTGNLGAQTSRTATLATTGQLPVAALELSQDLDSLSFTSTSTAAEYATWYFGDGDSSTLDNPKHLYPHEGTYEVMLVVSNPCGSDTTTTEVTIGFWADFEADRTHGCAPLGVNFKSKSHYRATTHFYLSPGGSPGGNIAPRRTFETTYNTPGVYDVELRVFAQGEADTLVKQDYITVEVGINPFGDIESQQTGNTVQIASGFNFADNYTWHFPNGDSLAGQSVSYDFDSDGVQQVVLQTSNHCGTVLDTATFIVGDAGAAFTFGNTSGCGTLYLPFQNTSPFVADSVLWLFPSGSIPSATFDNPSVVYTASGTYEAIMIAYIAGLADTVTQQFIIEILQDECPLPQVFTQVNGLEVTAWTDCPGSPGFQWDMGDGSTFSTQGITYQYDSTGIYNISLTVTGQCGGSATATATVSVMGPSATGGQLPPTGPFSVFPNPASGQVFFSSLSPVLGTVRIRLLSATGMPIAELKKGRWNGTAAMPLENVPSGLYFFEIQVDGQGVQQGKLVVVR